MATANGVPQLPSPRLASARRPLLQREPVCRVSALPSWRVAGSPPRRPLGHCHGVAALTSGLLPISLLSEGRATVDRSLTRP